MIAIDDCAGHELTQLEPQLGAAVASAAHWYGKPGMVAAEAQWLQFRDAECNAEASINRGGTIYPYVVTTCKVTLTLARIRELDTLVSNRPH